MSPKPKSGVNPVLDKIFKEVVDAEILVISSDHYRSPEFDHPGVKVIKIFEDGSEDFDICASSLPYLLEDQNGRKICMVVLDGLANGYEVTKMSLGGLSFYRFISNKLNKLTTKLAPFKVILLVTKFGFKSFNDLGAEVNIVLNDQDEMIVDSGSLRKKINF